MTRMGSKRKKMSGWKKKSTYMKTKSDQACMIDSKIQTAIREIKNKKPEGVYGVGVDSVH